MIEQDKIMHFCGGAIIYCVIFILTSLIFERVTGAATFAIGAAFFAGHAKEEFDSWKVNNYYDVWDMAATGMGGVFACLITVWFWL
jgi:hypothetical protein